MRNWAPGPVLLWTVVAVTAIGAAVIVSLSDHPDMPLPLSFPIPGVGAVFLAAGGLVLQRAPGSRIGWLMAAAGLAFLLNVLAQVDNAVLFTIGIAIGNTALALLVHLMLVYPTGSPDGLLERVGIVGAYLAGVPLSIALAHVYDPATNGCPTCPANLMLTQEDRPEAELEAILGIAAAIVAVIVAASLWRRWRAASGPRRRALGLVFWTGAAAAAIAAPALVVVGFELSGARVANLVYSMAVAVVPIAFVVGFIQNRLEREAALVRAVADLERSVGRTDVAGALTTALRDPALELRFWAPELAGWVLADGAPAPGREPADPRTVTEVSHDGHPLAAIVHDPDLDPELVSALAAGASLALERERLQAALRASVGEVERSRRRIIAASDAARRQVERDLHDGAQQRLVAALVHLRAGTGGAAPASRGSLERAAGELTEGIGELRMLVRGLRPPLLAERGLGPAVRALARRAALPVVVEELPEDRFAPELEAAAYLVVSEALTNAARHSRAPEARVALRRDGDALVISVADEGVGGASARRGSGLEGLADRVAALGGTLDVRSPPGGGTLLRATLPSAGPVPAAGGSVRRPPGAAPRPGPS